METKKAHLTLLFATIVVSSSVFAQFTILTNARQTIYQNGVPHTNRNGVVQTEFVPGVSFFPKILYHVHAFNDQGGPTGLNPTRFDLLTLAGFNTIETTNDLNLTLFEKLAEHNIQLIYTPARPVNASQWVPYQGRMLGWNIWDEPDGDLKYDEFPSRFEFYNTQKTGIRQYDVTTPCFVNTTNYLWGESYDWWVQWHQTSDISYHDNYVYYKPHGWTEINRPASLAYHYIGIPTTVSLAVSTANQAKPVWLILQSFASQNDWFFPTGHELRAMVYCGIVHGAVGINYFTYDNYLTRNVNILGISPDPSASYGSGRVATTNEITTMLSLWNAASGINHELIDLEPWLLSPTSSINYTVSKEGVSVTATPIRCMLKSYEGRLLLIAVNVDRAELTVRFDFSISGINLCQARQMYYNPATISLAGNILQDNFAPMEVKIYKLSYCGDLNDDVKVNIEDFSILASQWLN